MRALRALRYLRHALFSPFCRLFAGARHGPPPVTTRRDISMSDPLAFTIRQAITTAGIRKTSLYAAIKRGDLRARKSGRRTLILRDDLHGWLERLPTLELKRRASTS
jgi:excisionase family DNA binding protein